MFVGATFFGTFVVASLLLPILANTFEHSKIQRDPSSFAPLLFSQLCCLAYVMVFGAWLGGTVSVVWRSAPGRHTFATLSGGTSVGTFSVVGAIYLLGEPEASRNSMPVDLYVFYGVILAGTIGGLLLGHVVGRRLERAAAVTQTL